MTKDEELNNFFENLESLSNFSMSEKIFEFTNNLEPYMYCEFNKAFNRYCYNWLESKRTIQTKYDFPQVYIGQIKDFSINPELFELAKMADKAIRNEIVLNHYSFDENKIEFESYPQPMEGLFSHWHSILYSEVYRFQKIMHDLFKKIQPHQNEIVKTDENKNTYQHTQIFKDNNFEIWQRMFDKFNITKRSRTDIDFMFQIMKYDNLIYDNIGLTDIQNWINTVYEIAFDKIKYTDPKQESNKKRMIVYNLINPK